VPPGLAYSIVRWKNVLIAMLYVSEVAANTGEN